MDINRDHVVTLLRALGKQDAAEAARLELSEHVDTTRDADILRRYGITESDLRLQAAGSGGGAQRSP
jgi:hypothetical protein